MLKKILSISGKPGLFKLVSQGKNMYVVESLVDGKRIPAYASDKVVSLGDIAIYTTEDEMPLSKVLTVLKEKQNGAKIEVSSKADPETFRKQFAEILPNFDREKVYPTDIKKLFNWYNLLVDANLTDFETVEEEEEGSEDKEVAKIEPPKKEKQPKKDMGGKTATAKKEVVKRTGRSKK